MAVKAIPEGFHSLTPVLNVKGTPEAIAFYEKAFGAKELRRTADPDGNIMHAEVKIGDSVFMLAEAIFGKPTSSSLHIYTADADALWKRATAAGAKVAMPIADQFWGDRSGVVEDKWGNRWAIAEHKEDVPAEQMKSRVADAVKKMKEHPPAQM